MSGASTWNIDSSHTNVEFAVRHLMVSTVRGRLGGVAGTLVLDREHPANSPIDVTIDIASVDTKNEMRDNHLRSGDFFEAEKYPHMTFSQHQSRRRRRRPVSRIRKLDDQGCDPSGCSRR